MLQDPPEEFLRRVPQLMSLAFDADVDVPADWEGMKELFRADAAPFDRPVILLVDEFDNLPQGVIDRLVALGHIERVAPPPKVGRPPRLFRVVDAGVDA